ncbi:MAG TPA: GAF domain-containing protein [Gemmatimonadaceae bacterium]|nr:GAF domain-containing protein [Gemmatimonadaceae bacterium]
MLSSARIGAAQASGSEELDALSVGIVIVNRDWEIVRWNRALADLTDVAARDALGSSLWHRLPTAVGTHADAVLRRAMRDRVAYRGPALPLAIGPRRSMLRIAEPLGDGTLLIEIDHDPRAAEETAALDSVLAHPGESDVIASVGQSIADSTVPLETALAALAKRACDVLGCQGASVALVEDDAFHTVAAVGTLAPTTGQSSPIRSTLGELALAERRVIGGKREGLIAPMIVEGTAIGRVLAEHPAHGEFLPSHAVLLQRLADHAALAVRARQHRAIAERRVREAHSLTEVIQRINQSLELDRVLTLLAQYAAELVGGGQARVLILEDGCLCTSGVHGDAEPSLGGIVPVSGSFAGDCLAARKPLRTTEIGAPDSPWPWTTERVTPRRYNGIAVPLLVADRAIGVIAVFGTERCFTQHDEELLLVLAGHGAIAIENARLFRAAARTMHHASILATNARALARHVTPHAMFADIVRIAGEALRANGVGIYLVDQESRRVDAALQEGVGKEAVDETRHSFWETPLAGVMLTARPIFLPDLRAHVHLPAVPLLIEAGISSTAVLPLIIEGRARGVLTLRYRAPQPFDVEQQQLLTDFATHVALAVRNARLFDDLERRAARLEAVAQVQRAISEAVSLDEVYAKIYSAVASVVDSPCFLLLSFDEEAGVFVPEYCINDRRPIETKGLPRFPPGTGNTTQAFLTRHPNVAARSRAGWSGQVHVVEGQGEIAVVLSAPILHGDRVLGVLQAQSYDPQAYDWDDVDLIMLIARQAGSAIMNARAFEAERRELERAQFAAAVARVALAARELTDGATAVLDVVTRVCPASGMRISVIGSDGVRRTVAARGDAPSADATSGVFRVGLSSGERVRGELLVRDDALAPHIRESLRRLADPLALALETLQLREEERHQQERRRVLATALEAMEQPVFIVSRDLIVRYANGAAAAAFGYPPDELVGLHIGTFEVHTWTAQDRQAALAAMDGTGHWAGERLLRRRAGDDFTAWVIVSPIRDGTGRRVGHVIVVRDLTEERRIAEQLRQSEKLAALGELVAGVAHEVNNPLTGISAFAQLLLEDTLSEEQTESVSLMKREADRAVAVIRDLLAFARKTGPRSVVVDMNDLLEQTLRLRAYGMRSTGVTIETHLDPSLARVRGDDRQLQQVLLNLIVNAEHAMSNTSVRQLSVRTANEGSRVVVEIKDTGTGMTPDVQKRIFEPFFTTKPEGTGTGLGLSVSYGIMQSHAGTLSVQSAVGIGSTFRISLPAAPNAEQVS